jgi:putative intracellular protease/amidase
MLAPRPSDGRKETSMDIAIPLFDRITALDAIGPYEVLSRLPGARVRFVALTPGPYRTDNRQLTLIADEPLAAVPRPEIVMVPGGFGTRELMTPNPLLDWIRTAHETSQWTTSVCTGSLLLGAAGVLKGLEATTHWAALEQLRELGARPTLKRVVVQGKVVTAAGVSSGIDMALTLAARIAGDEVAQSIQLGIEYDPQPPFNAGSPETAPPHVVARLRGRLQERLATAAAERAAGA